MGLRARLARFASMRSHAFLIAVPGATRTRLLVEAELRRRGGRSVASPVAAGILVVCGTPGGESTAVVDAVWSDMPGPRSLVRLGEAATADEVREAFDRAVEELKDVAVQRADAIARRQGGPWTPDAGAEGMEHGHHGGGHGEHGGEDDQPGDSGHAGHHAGAHAEDDEDDEGDEADEHGEHMGHEHMGHGEGHGGHGGHEHHMGAPMGLAMAGRADDRDGLKLDVLHVPLGPALRDWPAGLVVRLTLQGDVVQNAEVGVMGAAGEGRSFWDEPWLRAAAGEAVSEGEAARRRAAAHLDSVGRFLAVAGWEHTSGLAHALRDDVMAGAAGDVLAARFARLDRRVGGSITLRWMVRGLGAVDDATVERHGLTGPAGRAGDVLDRLKRWLEGIGAALRCLDSTEPLSGTDGPRGPVERRPSAAMLAALPELLDGAELAEARLTIASLDPDLDQLALGGDR